MGIKLSEVEAGSEITIIASVETTTMEMKANIVRMIKDDIAIIEFQEETEKRYNFSNVRIQVEYAPGEEVPYIWRVAQIVTIQSQYVLQVQNEAVRNNRRDSFRVGVSLMARLRIKGRGDVEVVVRDVSLSGFGITDLKKCLNLKMGDEAAVTFEDAGHVLQLAGKVVRINESETMDSYGFIITNMCKDLSSYISIKQRRK